MWRPLSARLLLVADHGLRAQLTLVGGLLVLLVLQPLLGMSPILLGFVDRGGLRKAAMARLRHGPTYERWGWKGRRPRPGDGPLGLLSSTVVGRLNRLRAGPGSVRLGSPFGRTPLPLQVPAGVVWLKKRRRLRAIPHRCPTGGRNGGQVPAFWQQGADRQVNLALAGSGGGCWAGCACMACNGERQERGVFARVIDALPGVPAGAGWVALLVAAWSWRTSGQNPLGFHPVPEPDRTGLGANLLITARHGLPGAGPCCCGTGYR